MKKVVSLVLVFLLITSLFPAVAFAEGSGTEYTVTLSMTPADSGIVTGAGTYADGDTVTISAKPRSGYRFDHWERADGTKFGDVSSANFVIHEDYAYVAVFTEDPSNVTKYTLDLPDSISVMPYEEFTAITMKMPDLVMLPEADGKTPVRLRVILSSGTLINEADDSKTIPVHPDSIITTMPAFNQCMFDFTSAENRTFYVRIENSSWTSATPGTYTGTISYIVRWLYDDNKWSGDIETGTIPVTVTIPEQMTGTAAPKAGWQKSGGRWWYRNEDGSWPADAWQRIDGAWYHFDASGYMQTGWVRDGDAWYYLKPSGAMATGWQKIGDAWYYLRSSGAMATGWVRDGDAWYYLQSSGAMATGWLKLDGVWYYLKSSGAMATGWLKLDGVWYYCKSSGAAAIGETLTIGGKTYAFDSQGRLKS